MLELSDSESRDPEFRDGERRSRRIAVIGEALVDVVTGGETHPGGSPMNVAVGLARLGFPPVLHTRIGTDAFGGMIRAHVADAGVRLGDRAISVGASWSAVATVDTEGKARYVFDLAGEIEVPDLSEIDLVHTGSIGALREPGSSAVLEAFRSAPATMLRSFDPNIRADVLGSADAVRQRVTELARRCHVVKLSDEDAAWLAPDSTPCELLEAFAGYGVRFVVLTRGAQGCLALIDGKRYERSSWPVDLVDTIGAGDAFMSGLLAGLLREDIDRKLVGGSVLPADRVVAVLETAIASASIAVSRAGADPPRADELAAALEAGTGDVRGLIG